MARNFKICFDDGWGNKEVFVIQPNDFKSLMDEIYVRRPESRDKSLKCYYEDSDGDKISITKPSDFELFLEQNVNKIFAETNEETMRTPSNQSLQNSIPTVSTPPGFSNLEAKSSSVIEEIRRIHHDGILCDVCDKEVYGFRYKCLDCEEFDMCMDCEPKQIHKEHLLLRITNPIDGERNLRLQDVAEH